MFKRFKDWLTLLVLNAVESAVLRHFARIYEWQTSTTKKLRLLEWRLQQSKKLPAFVVARGNARETRGDGPNLEILPVEFSSGVRFLSPGEMHRFTILPWQHAGDVKVSVEAPFVIIEAKVGNMSYMRSDSPDGAPSAREISVGFVNVANKITVDVQYPTPDPKNDATFLRHDDLGPTSAWESLR